jgi:XTP/dITP diphosphohydrolase
VTFASTNRNKFAEAQAILNPFGINVEFANADLLEIQSDSLDEIAREKAKSAYGLVGKPVIVEDDGLFISALKGFPGQYSSYVFQTVGNQGILRLLAESQDRSALFRSMVAFCDGKSVSISEGIVNGRISESASQGGWGYDPIFVPEGSSMTFGELGEEKNNFSHRRKALEKFANWMLAQGSF